MFEKSIGNDRFLTASVYEGDIVVHVREYTTGHGKRYPTKKGAFFTKARWATFVGYMDDVERSVELLKAKQPIEYFQHIGGGYHVTVSKDVLCVNIRRYFQPSTGSKPIPTRSGIALRLFEWERLVSTIDELHESVPDLKVATPCYASDDHANQMGYYDCRECNPFDRIEVVD